MRIGIIYLSPGSKQIWILASFQKRTFKSAQILDKKPISPCVLALTAQKQPTRWNLIGESELENLSWIVPLSNFATTLSQLKFQTRKPQIKTRRKRRISELKTAKKDLKLGRESSRCLDKSSPLSSVRWRAIGNWIKWGWGSSRIKDSWERSRGFSLMSLRLLKMISCTQMKMILSLCCRTIRWIWTRRRNSSTKPNQECSKARWCTNSEKSRTS